MSNILSMKALSVGYRNRKHTKVILDHINLELKRGQLTSLLGANGSGKSTLIRTIAGVQKSLSGSIQISGKSLDGFNLKELAKSLSLVLAQTRAVGNLTVYALVSLGRFPYTSWMGNLQSADKSIIQDALESVGILELANEHIDELSDGQKQKVMIARALAQNTDIILLDEPTAHLDFPNKLEVMHLLRELAIKKSKSILISSHDLDSALSLSDQLWLIDRDRKVHAGVPEDLVLNGALEKAFVQDELNFDYEQGQFKRKLKDQAYPISVEGVPAITRWLKSALERQGYIITDQNQSKRHISVVEEPPKYRFRISDVEGEFNS
ncbi:MAG TPA: ABC transporter ATP-binding protein, partial [Roseivirga sp.]